MPGSARLARAGLACVALVLPLLSLGAESSPAAPDAAHTGSTVAFARVVSRTADAPIGYSSTGRDCTGRHATDGKSDIDKTWSAAAAIAFKKEAPGEHVLGGGEPSPFDGPSTTPREADYLLGIALLEVEVDLCFAGNALSGPMNGRMRYDLFSTRQQRVVLSRTQTVHYTATGFAEGSSIEQYLSRLFAPSIHDFFADPAVVATLDAPPPAPPAPAAPASANAPAAAASSTVANAPAASSPVRPAAATRKIAKAPAPAGSAATPAR
jgi:hypothetical protein